MGVYIWNKLPSEYQEVEYIQSSGTQYIDTGIIPKTTTKVELKTMVTGFSNSNEGSVYGAWYNYSSNGRFNLRYTTDGGYYFGYGSNNGANNKVSVGLNAEAVITNYISGGIAHNIVNGTDSSYSGATFTEYTGTMYVFKRNTGTGTDNSFTYSRMYYFKIWDNGTLVRDFIPCYRKSDSVIGLYDLVNNQFYTNSGSGTFSKGSDVNTYRESSLKNAYIGEVYEYSYDFKNKSITTLNNDGWSIPEGQSYVTFDSTGMNLRGLPCRLKKSLPSGILSTAKKITLVSSWQNNGYATRFALASVVQSGSSAYITGGYADTRTGTRIIELYGTQYSTSGGFSTGSYTMKSIMDLENKIATLSITGYSDITQSITDAEITNIRNNSPLLYIYSYSVSTSTTIYCKDVSVSIQ